MGPMATWRGLHEYRKCQFLSIEFKDSADKPITDKPIHIFNCHLPSSEHRPLNPTVRKQVLEWLLEHVGDRALIGGDLNSSRMALDDKFKKDPGIFYLYEEDHWHGDIIIAKGVQARSVACNVSSTSKAHQMCMATVQLESNSAGKPAAMAWKTLETTASASASSSEEEEHVDWCEEGSSEEEKVADSPEEEGKHSSKKAQAMASQHPLADALFSELGALSLIHI